MADMVFLPLLLFLLLYVLVSSRQQRAAHALAMLTKTVSAITEAVLSNDLAHLSAPPPSSAKACHFLRTLAQQHLYRGELQVAALRLLQQAIGAAREQQRVRGQLRMLFMTRVGGVIVFSMLGNFLLSQVIAAAPHSYLAPLIGCAVLLVGVVGLEKTMPASWFWRQHDLSPCGRNWAAALFDCRNHTFHPTLQHIQARELTLGIDLSAEKTAFLTHWQHERQDAEKTALHKHQDFFPVLELLVFGTLATMHLSPVLRNLLVLLG